VKLPDAALRHLAHDHVVWLTTVTAKEVPSPTPVWFVVDDDSILVFTGSNSRKVANIAARPTVTLHFNTDEEGDDVVVLTAHAVLVPDAVPSRNAGYLEKYRESIGGLGMSLAEFDADFDMGIRLFVRRAWLGPE
jgi:PPOX class probable F420-dependent enzyme